MRKFLIIALLILGVSAVAISLYWQFAPVERLRAVQLIPKDAVYMIELKEPVHAWDELSASALWKNLRKNEYFADIDTKARTVDSLLNSNKKLFEWVGNNPVLISAHMTGLRTYDFLCVANLGDGGTKLGFLKKTLASFAGYKITERSFESHQVLQLSDGTEDQIYLATVGDMLVLSYTPKLVISALKSYKNPELADDSRFVKVRSDLKSRSQFTVYLQLTRFKDFLNIYLQDPGTFADIATTFDWGGYSLNFDENKMALQGFTYLQEKEQGLLFTMLSSGAGTRKSDEILSDRTAWFMSLGISNFQQLFDDFEKNIQKNPEKNASYTENKKKIEKLLKINLRDDFLSWFGEDLTVCALKPTDSSSFNPQMALIVHVNDTALADKKLAFIEKQIKKRTPVKFKTYDHNGQAVHYLMMKGFFKLFFGKMFEKFDHPYYTRIGNFVIFTLSEEGLTNFIDDVQADKKLNKLEKYQNFVNNFDNKSSVLTYLNMDNFFPVLPYYVSPDTRIRVENQEATVRLFEQLGFQFSAKSDKFASRIQIN